MQTLPTETASNANAPDTASKANDLTETASKANALETASKANALFETASKANAQRRPQRLTLYGRRPQRLTLRDGLKG